MFAKIATVGVVVLTVIPCLAQQPDPDSSRVKTVEAFIGLLKQSDDNIDELAKSTSKRCWSRLPKKDLRVRF